MRLTHKRRISIHDGIMEKVYPESWFQEKTKAIADWLTYGECKEISEALAFQKEYPEFVADTSNAVEFCTSVQDAFSGQLEVYRSVFLPFDYPRKQGDSYFDQAITFKQDRFGAISISYGIDLPADIKDAATEILKWMEKRERFSRSLWKALRATETVAQLKEKLPDASELINSILAA